MEAETNSLSQNESKNNNSMIQSSYNFEREPFWKQGNINQIFDTIISWLALRIRLMRAIVLAKETIEKKNPNKEDLNFMKEAIF